MVAVTDPTTGRPSTVRWGVGGGGGRTACAQAREPRCECACVQRYAQSRAHADAIPPRRVGGGGAQTVIPGLPADATPRPEMGMRGGG